MRISAAYALRAWDGRRLAKPDAPCYPRGAPGVASGMCGGDPPGRGGLLRGWKRAPGQDGRGGWMSQPPDGSGYRDTSAGNIITASNATSWMTMKGTAPR